LEHEVENGEFEHFEMQLLDIVNIKIYALLMCIGKPEQKGEVLFDMCVGSANNKVAVGKEDE
tara:strand:- start:613 stop:798 length:186 start_codon:yes stop_codon:yes gene_type:complete